MYKRQKRLFLWGFENFSTKTVLSELDMLADVPVTLSKIDSVAVHPASAVDLILPNDVKPEELEQKLVLPENVKAPVTAGQELGSVELSHNGKVYVSVPLVALNSCLLYTSKSSGLASSAFARHYLRNLC